MIWFIQKNMEKQRPAVPGACSLHALQVGLQSKSPRSDKVITIGEGCPVLNTSSLTFAGWLLMPTRWHSPSSASFDGESPGSEANCWELQSWRKLTWNRNSSEVDSSWFCTFLFPFSFFTANDCNKSLLVPLWSRRNFKDRSPSLNVHVESSMPNANFFTQMYTNVTVDVLSFYMFRYMHLHILNTMYCTWSCGYVFTVMILTRAVQTHTHTHMQHTANSLIFFIIIYIYI